MPTRTSDDTNSLGNIEMFRSTAWGAWSQTMIATWSVAGARSARYGSVGQTVGLRAEVLRL